MARAAHNSNWDPWTGEKIRPSKQRNFHIYLLEKSFGKSCRHSSYFTNLQISLPDRYLFTNCHNICKLWLGAIFWLVVFLHVFGNRCYGQLSCQLLFLLTPTYFIILFANCYFRVRVVGVVRWSGWSGWSGRLAGLDDMHSTCFTWSKPSNYWKKVKSHLWRMDERTNIMNVEQYSSQAQFTIACWHQSLSCFNILAQNWLELSK